MKFRVILDFIGTKVKEKYFIRVKTKFTHFMLKKTILNFRRLKNKEMFLE